MNICSWVKENYEVDISKSSMSNWLHDLGFSYQQFTKGVYFDGHEREDVVKDRDSYLKKFESIIVANDWAIKFSWSSGTSDKYVRCSKVTPNLYFQ